jgi:hypothetical protein
VTIDLSGPETPGGKVGRVLIGGILFVVFGLLAIACGIVYFIGDFIPLFSGDSGWGWATIVAPFAGALFLGLAILGFELLRRGRKAQPSDYEGLTRVLEATGLAEVEVVGEDAAPAPTNPQPQTQSKNIT